MAEYCDSIILSVDGKDMDDVIIEMTDSSDVGLKGVETMGRDDAPRGFKQGSPKNSISLKCEQGGPVDFYELRRQRKSFRIQKKPNVGDIVTYEGCRVGKISDSHQRGDSGQTVEVMYQRRTPTPVAV